MIDKTTQNKVLGRKLSDIMGEFTPIAAAERNDRSSAMDTRLLPIEFVEANPQQPRRRFPEEALSELTQSIREKGIIQPLIVRPVADKRYEIVAGERRWRAAQRARLHEVPVVIREIGDAECLEIALIENIQRSDLNPVEESEGFKQLMHRFGHTQQKLAETVGKSRSHIANILRLLSLPTDVLEHLRTGMISAGHARALLMSVEPSKLAQRVIAHSLTVRDVERLVKQEGRGVSSSTDGKSLPQKDANTKALEGELKANLGLKVTIKHRPGQEVGSMTIAYSTLDEFDKLCRLLSVNSSAKVQK